MGQPITTELASRMNGMKVGMQGSFLTVPEQWDKSRIAEWQLRRSREWGCTVLQTRFLPEDRGQLEDLGKLARSLSIELETTAPGVFQLAGPSRSAEAEAQFRQALERAKLLDMPVVRTGYGRLNVESSRFNRRIGLQEHMDALVPSLKEAGRIAAEADLVVAVENHCDFTGRELARILDAVDSPHVGAALDTANGFTIFCDPQDDIEALAPYAFTTHMKDMVVVDNTVKGMTPFAAYGCNLGEGHVDLAGAVRLLAQHSPRADGLHLIIEPGWMRWDPERDIREHEAEFYGQGIQYLNHILSGQVG